MFDGIVGIFHRAIPQTQGRLGSWRRVLGYRNKEQNQVAKAYAKKYEQNDPDYISDKKWYEFIEEREAEAASSGTGTGTGGEGSPFGTGKTTLINLITCTTPK